MKYLVFLWMITMGSKIQIHWKVQGDIIQVYA